MSLQNLLDPEVVIPVLMGVGLIHYIDSCSYNLFKTKLSFSREDFKDAQSWEEYMNHTSRKESSEDAKQNAIKLYSSLLDKKVPKFLIFSRPFFYFQIKKEISYMKEESVKRLSELKAA
ncbi:MAG: hypothetical protein AABY32_04490 [Nanoarchaeota archaeon]